MRARCLAVWIAATVVLAACGEDEESEMADDPAPVEESETAAEAEDATLDDEPDEEQPGEPGEPDDGDAAGDAPESDENDDAGEPAEPNEHRPDEDVGAVADCEKIIDEDPGAMIAFPSEEGPGWLEAGPGPVVVEFIGCSNTFEGSLAYRAFHGDDTEPTIEGVTTGGSLGEWERFEFDETFWTPGSWTIEVFEIDAATGDEQLYDEVTITVE